MVLEEWDGRVRRWRPASPLPHPSYTIPELSPPSCCDPDKDQPGRAGRSVDEWAWDGGKEQGARDSQNRKRVRLACPPGPRPLCSEETGDSHFLQGVGEPSGPRAAFPPPALLLSHMPLG